MTDEANNSGEEHKETFKITFTEVDEHGDSVKEHKYVLRLTRPPLEEFFLTSGYLALATGRIRDYNVIRSNRPSGTGIQRLYLEALAEREMAKEKEAREQQ